jgi:CRISPR/Cas system-associated exonuclease Cas4 (RecB family)
VSDLKKHAVIAPSKADRIINCQHSVLLTEWMKSWSKPSEPNDAAEWGTLVHDYSEKLWKKQAFVIKDYEAYEEAKEFVSYLKERLKGFERVQIEKKLKLKGSDLIFGTADVVAYSRDVTYIGDLKTGMNDVEADGNLQLLTYAALEFSTYDDQDKERTFILEIYQPRTDNIVSVEVTAEELKQYIQLLHETERIILNDPVRFNSGSHCGWCEGKFMCPEIKKRIDEVLDKEAHDKVLLENYWLVDVMAKLAADVKTVLRERLESGQDISGVKLSEPMKFQNWSDEDSAVKALKKAGLDTKAIYTNKIITPAAAKKSLPKDRWQYFDKLIEEKKGNPRLIVDKAKRG